MRVVGGSARGRRLLEVPGTGTRPIMDRVKTALFDVVRPRLAGTKVLDLFAGSGAVGIEALSQGADFCTFLDLGAKAVATIKANLATIGFADRAEVRLVDALRYLNDARGSFDLVYVAPPQYKSLWIQALRRIDGRPDLLTRPSAEKPETDPGLVVVQIDPKEYESLELDTLRETARKRYGNTLLVFYETHAAPNSIELSDPVGLVD
jgi:16S rRNA (guanine966-N2)-methyltransferase